MTTSYDAVYINEKNLEDHRNDIAVMHHYNFVFYAV